MATKPKRARSKIATPNKERIRGDVIRIIAAFGKRDSAAITGAEELVKDLRIMDESMPFLRSSLLGYMKHFNDSALLKVSELRKPKQTVNGVVDIVKQRI